MKVFIDGEEKKSNKLLFDFPDKTLIFRKERNSPIKARLNLSGTKISYSSIEAHSVLLKKEYALTTTCSIDTVETSFRCILGEDEMNMFIEQIRKYIPDCTIKDDGRLLESMKIPENISLNQSSMREAMKSALDKVFEINLPPFLSFNFTLSVRDDDRPRRNSKKQTGF